HLLSMYEPLGDKCRGRTNFFHLELSHGERVCIMNLPVINNFLHMHWIDALINIMQITAINEDHVGEMLRMQNGRWTLEGKLAHDELRFIVGVTEYSGYGSHTRFL